jgi:hypothetical protein
MAYFFSADLFFFSALPFTQLRVKSPGEGDRQEKDADDSALQAQQPFFTSRGFLQDLPEIMTLIIKSIIDINEAGDQRSFVRSRETCNASSSKCLRKKQ